MNADEFKDALGADVVLPVTPLTVHTLRQQIVQAGTLLKEARDLLYHNGHTDPAVCPGCVLEDRIDDFLAGQADETDDDVHRCVQHPDQITEFAPCPQCAQEEGD